MFLKTFYQQFLDSYRLSQRIRIHKKLKSPSDRDLFEGLKKKKEKEVELMEKQNNLEEKKLKESYEYKIFEYFNVLDFHLRSNDKMELLKYCDFDFYNNPKNWRSNFPYHYIVQNKDYKWTYFQILGLLIVMIVLIKLGEHNGMKDSILYDVIKYNIVDVKAEEEIFNELVNKSKPVIILYYYPTKNPYIEMMYAMGDIVENYGNEKFTMMKVNCKYNLELCKKKATYLKMPQWELIQIPDEVDINNRKIRKFPVIPCEYNSSYEGLEAFLIENNLVSDKYSPIERISHTFINSNRSFI